MFIWIMYVCKHVLYTQYTVMYMMLYSCVFMFSQCPWRLKHCYHFGLYKLSRIYKDRMAVITVNYFIRIQFTGTKDLRRLNALARPGDTYFNSIFIRLFRPFSFHLHYCTNSSSLPLTFPILCPTYTHVFSTILPLWFWYFASLFLLLFFLDEILSRRRNLYQTLIGSDGRVSSGLRDERTGLFNGCWSRTLN